MKKKCLILITVISLVCASLPITVFADEFEGAERHGETSVSYTVNSSYIVNIPATVNINESPSLIITASSMNIDWGRRVSVFIDGGKTFENGGNFYLYKDKRKDPEAKIKCEIRMGSQLVNGIEAEVGRFDDGSLENTASNWLTFTPMHTKTTPLGTYTGIIYFKIEMT